MLGRFSYRRVGRFILGSFILLHAVLAAEPQAGDAFTLAQQPGHVVLMRHAQAPGVGDPPGMVLGDCATQRNLDDRGRAQAKRLGERFRAAGATDLRIYTSQWCRCRETARLLGLGPVEELTALNSFFEQPETKATRVKALRAFLDGLPRDGPSVVLVTHQVTITALTGYVPASGEGLVLKLRPGGGFERVGELKLDDERLGSDVSMPWNLPHNYNLCSRPSSKSGGLVSDCHNHCRTLLTHLRHAVSAPLSPPCHITLPSIVASS